MPSNRKRWSAVAAVCAALFVSQADAALTLIGPDEASGSGLGAVDTVLTLQAHGAATFEAGAVGVGADNEMLITGDAKTGASQTQLLRVGDLGIASASDLRVVFNANEPGNAAKNVITLNDLVLNIYNTNGTLVFSSGAFGALSFDHTTTGIGRADVVFGLDAADVALAQASVFSGNFADYRIGLSARADGVQGGPETFFLAAAISTPAVPEPQTQALLLAGLGVMAYIARRRRAA